mmetsp:Transcript_123721/g.174386  ORF Transcript_123721/g.174386 Transcript_123721/m.174386 type:complete len:108 (-) Transcript_123721:21-344(-)
MATPTLYRSATLGFCLVDSLSELVDRGVLDDKLSNAIVEQFDRSMAEAFKTIVPSSANISIKAHLHDYNGNTNVYKFTLTDVAARLQSQTMNLEAMKVVALNQKITR